MAETRTMAVLVGTAGGLYRLGREERQDLAGREVTALARDGSRWWAITDGRTLWRGDRGAWVEIPTVPGLEVTCLAATPVGLLVGTAGAHLLRLTDAGLAPVEAFEAVEGRAAWHTPWGDPADARSIAVDAGGAVYVNVHVGGVVRSTDGGRTWTPTLDIEADVHQVLAHPARAGLVLAAAAIGLGVSADGGSTWRFDTDGLHARYLRAVAVAGDTVLISVSTGPGGRRAAVYRRRLDDGGPFERCRDGLPEWFRGNIDTACLAAAGPIVALGTEDGRVFRSDGGGATWTLVTKGLPAVRCVALAPAS